MQSKISLTLSLLIVGIVGVLFYLIVNFSQHGGEAPSKKMSYHTNIVKDTQENTNFRRVLFTGQNSQLVVMSIPPGGEVGNETHKYT